MRGLIPQHLFYNSASFLLPDKNPSYDKFKLFSIQITAFSYLNVTHWALLYHRKTQLHTFSDSVFYYMRLLHNTSEQQTVMFLESERCCSQNYSVYKNIQHFLATGWDFFHSVINAGQTRFSGTSTPILPSAIKIQLSSFQHGSVSTVYHDFPKCMLICF